MVNRAKFDHLAIAARTLVEGAAWLADRLGIAPDPGGRHLQLGTHNRLLSLGQGEYLELIATDPDGQKPDFPRWFGLDEFDGPPRLVSWIARSAAPITQSGASPRQFQRDDLRWQFSLPDDGRPLDGGVTPALIDWQGSPHPSSRLRDHGLRLEALRLSHPAPLPALPVDDPRITLQQGPVALQAMIRTPSGIVRL